MLLPKWLSFSTDFIDNLDGLELEYIRLKNLSKERVSITKDIITWISHFFTKSNPFFYKIQIFSWIRNGYSLIDFDAIQSAEFMKSLNFSSNLKKKTAKKPIIFHLKMNFYGYIFLLSLKYGT